MEKATIIGVDLAKNVFQVHGAAADGTVLYRKKLTRLQLHRFMAEQPACLVAMRPAAGRITGRARCGGSAMTSG